MATTLAATAATPTTPVSARIPKWKQPLQQQQQQQQFQQQQQYAQQHYQAAAVLSVPSTTAPPPTPAAAAAAAAAPATRAVTLDKKYIVCIDKPCGRLLHGFKVGKRPFTRRSSLQIPRAVYASFLEGQGRALQRLHSRPHQAIVQMLDAVDPSPNAEGEGAHDGFLIFQPLFGDLTRPMSVAHTGQPPTPGAPPPPPPNAAAAAAAARPYAGLAAAAAAAAAIAPRSRSSATSSNGASSSDAAAAAAPSPPLLSPLHDAKTLKRLFRKMLAAVAHCHSLGICVRHIEPASFAWTNEACTDLRLTGLSYACVVAPPQWQAAPCPEAKAHFAADVVAVADVFRFLLRRRQQQSTVAGASAGTGAAAAMTWMLELLKEMLVVPAAAAAAAAAKKQPVFVAQQYCYGDGDADGIALPKTAAELLAGPWLRAGFGETIATSDHPTVAAARKARGSGSGSTAVTAGVPHCGSALGSVDDNDEHVVPVFTPTAAAAAAATAHASIAASTSTTSSPATHKSVSVVHINDSHGHGHGHGQRQKRRRVQEEEEEESCATSPARKARV